MLPASILPVVLLVATLLCTLVTGFLLAFSIVVMPGLGTLPSREFLRAFQAIDKVIQNNHPLFMVLWIGSIVALIVATGLSMLQLEGVRRTLIIVAAAAYLLGTQLPTFAINIPLNNRLQTLEIETLDEASQVTERTYFESRWNRWNTVRTVFACIASVLLLVVLRLI